MRVVIRSRVIQSLLQRRRDAVAVGSVGFFFGGVFERRRLRPGFPPRRRARRRAPPLGALVREPVLDHPAQREVGHHPRALQAPLRGGLRVLVLEPLHQRRPLVGDARRRHRGLADHAQRDRTPEVPRRLLLVHPLGKTHRLRPVRRGSGGDDAGVGATSGARRVRRSGLAERTRVQSCEKTRSSFVS